MTSTKNKIKERFGIPEITDRTGQLWKAVFAEFLGNFLLNFLGCSSCLYLSDPNSVVSIMRVAFAFGLVIFALALAIGHVSGAHLNPAVSIAFILAGKITIFRGIFYVIVQCAGSIAGSALLKAVSPKEYEVVGFLGLPAINDKLSPFQGACTEFILSFFLVFVVFGVTDPNRSLLFIMGPLGIGFAVAAGHLAGIDSTGAAMNPARALGSALIANKWDNHWVYWLGPIIGGNLAGIVYTYVFSARKDGDYLLVPSDDKKGKEGA